MENHDKDGYWDDPKLAQDAETFLTIVDRMITMHAFDRALEGGTPEELRERARIFSVLAEVGFDGWISIEDGDGVYYDWLDEQPR